MLLASLADRSTDPTPSTSSICTGEASATKDLSTQWMGTGLKNGTHLQVHLFQCVYTFSYDGELHLVHYKSTYDNISAAIADNQSDSLAVVGLFLREAGTWDQWRGSHDAESIINLKTAALGLSRSWRGPTAPKMDMEIVFDQLLSSIT